MASSKVAIATFGNLAFALALCLYRLVTKVCLWLAPGSIDKYVSLLNICKCSRAGKKCHIPNQTFEADDHFESDRQQEVFLQITILKRVSTMQVFLGQLRDSEVERINERISQAVMETCLAMTIFREEFNVGFVAMFTILTFIKVFHWLVQDRVDFIETTPQVSRLNHIRVISFMFLLLVTSKPGCPSQIIL